MIESPLPALVIGAKVPKVSSNAALASAVGLAGAGEPAVGVAESDEGADGAALSVALVVGLAPAVDVDALSPPPLAALAMPISSTTATAHTHQRFHKGFLPWGAGDGEEVVGSVMAGGLPVACAGAL